MDLFDLDTIKLFLGDAIGAEVTKFTIGFVVAAWIHSGRVKKEIASQLEGIRLAMLDLGSALRQDLSNQSERIGKVEVGMSKLGDRVNKLDGGKRGWD